MTTNVFDSHSSVIATDSRWSSTFGRWLVYVDDVRFDKIVLFRNAALVFAGFGRVVQAWKDWIASDPPDLSMTPAFEGICVCLVDVNSRQTVFTRGDNIARNGGYFAGSGSIHAYTCWAVNKDARRSIESAKKVDPKTGGDVRFFDMASGSHNLDYPGPTGRVTLQMVDAAIQERGIYMDMSKHGAPVPFKRADLAADASNDELAEFKAKIARGELSAEAPCDAMYNEWTEEEKERFKDALSRTLGIPR